MKMRSMEWQYLRGVSHWLLAAVVASGAMVAASAYYLAAQERGYEQLNSERDSARSDYLDAENRDRLIAEYYSRYLTLRQRGMIGAEDRLDWVETVRSSARQLHLPKLQYQIMPRETYTLASLAEFSGVTLYASRMKLEMELMHEGDLSSVISSLGRSAPGAMHVESCLIRRLLDDPEANLLSPNLAATCELMLFTIQPEAAASGEF
ncbi:MAG: hypothetical protein IT488_01355 [Gammaproteobacteria bacterium]|nr:hypothetical protein [Gammaproteobacteria bacterium]